LARVHHSRGTPWIAVIVTMILGIITIIASSGNIPKIASVAVFRIFLVYALVNISLIVLRLRKPALKSAFRSPISIKGNFPILAAIGLVTSVLILFQFDYDIKIWGLVTLALIVVLSLLLNRKYMKRAQQK
jgi:APA family basic amino acid/polyamine antiporter